MQTQAQAQAQARPISRGHNKGKRKKKFIIAGGIVLLIIAYMAYAGFQSAAHYYLTVDEMFAKGEAAYKEQQITLGGKVVDGSIQSEGLGKALRFNVSGVDKVVAVTYTGIVPDTFEPGADVVLDGRLVKGPKGDVFEAVQLKAKCPSKFVPFVN